MNSAISPYHETLTLQYLSGCDFVQCVDVSTIHWIIRNLKLSVKMRSPLISEFAAAATRNWRFEYDPEYVGNMRKTAENLVPHQGLNLLSVSLVPLKEGPSPPHQYSYKSLMSEPHTSVKSRFGPDAIIVGQVNLEGKSALKYYRNHFHRSESFGSPTTA